MDHTDDVIDELAGLTPGSPLAELRAQRPEIARYAQGSYEALLEPADIGGVSLVERDLIALRVAILGGAPIVADWHRTRLLASGVSADTITAVEQFPAGSLLTSREVALLRHTDRVTRLPAASTKEQLGELSAAGLSPRDIVTVAQLISFLSFQLRTLAGLRVLAEGL